MTRIPRSYIFIFSCLLFVLISPAQIFAARLWSGGFELGSVTEDVEINLAASDAAIDTTVVRSGTYSLKIALTSTAARRPNIFRAASTNLAHTFFRAYVRFEAWPTAANSFMMSGNSDATRQIFVKVDNTGILSLVDEDGSIGSATSALSLNTWYRIELESDVTTAAGSHVIKLYVDGTEVVGATNRSISLGQDQYYFGGNMQTETHTTGTWYFDDLAINDTSGSAQTGLPGDGFIVHMYPDSAGDAAATLGTFADIDEVTPDDATTFIEVDTDTGGQQANYNFGTSASVGIGASDIINLVQVGTRQRAESATPAAWTPQIKSQSGSTIENGTSTTQNDTTWQTNLDSTFFRGYRLTSYTDPYAGGAWTPALLDTMIAGVNVTDGVPDLHFSTLWVLVDFSLAPDVSPAAPTLHDIPFDNEKTGDSTPDFEFTGSDPDGTASIIYQIQIDDDSAFGSPLVNCESDTSCATGAGSFTNTVTGGDTNPFNEGERIRFTPTTAMTTDVTYYWRVRAEDDSASGGSGNYGSYSATRSVTFVSDTSPSQWFQTTDEQFDTVTFSTTKTNGSDQVVLGALTATGGTTTVSGGYTYHTFTSSGTFQVTAGSGNVEVLVVGGGAGGGTGGSARRGGGGAGGKVSN